VPLNAPLSIEGGEFFFLNIPSISGTQWHPFSLAMLDTPGELSGAGAVQDKGAVGGAQQESEEAEDGQAGTVTAAAAARYSSGKSVVASQASGEFSGHTGMAFLVKNMGEGTWTGDLNAMGLAAAESDKAAVDVRLDGPYGLLSVDVARYKSIVLFAGGIGVTPMLSVLQRMASSVSSSSTDHPETGAQPAKTLSHVTFVWASRELPPLLPEVAGVLREAEAKGANVVIHNTDRNANVSADMEGVLPAFSDMLQSIKSGRADPAAILDNVIMNNAGSEVAVLTCGPEPFVQGVEAAARPRGCHVHKETFAF